MYNDFRLSRDLKWPHDYRVMWLSIQFFQAAQFTIIVSHHKSPSCKVLWLYALGVMWIYEYDPIMVSHASAKLGGNRHRGTGDFRLHIISQDHVIRGSSNTMCRSPSKLVIKLPGSVAISTLVVEINFLTCHVFLTRWCPQYMLD